MKPKHSMPTIRTLMLTLLCVWPASSLAEPGHDACAERIARLEEAVSGLEKRLSALEGSSVQNQRPLPVPKASGDWTKKSNWRLLGKGMTKDQVRELLGEPEKISASGPLEYWHWKYPLGPSVTFYDDLVHGWDEK